MTDGAIETVMERTRQEEIRLVRFLYADHGGIIRGKAAGTARLRERMSSGIGHTVAMMAMSMLDQLQPVPGMGPVGEVRIVPDPETFVALPYAPGAGASPFRSFSGLRTGTRPAARISAFISDTADLKPTNNACATSA